MDYFTDPASAACWAAEPHLRRMMVDFGDDVEIAYVMGGLARDLVGRNLLSDWLAVAARSGMPLDPRLWSERPPSSTYPACIAVKAAAEQGAAARGALPAGAARGPALPAPPARHDRPARRAGARRRPGRRALRASTSPPTRTSRPSARTWSGCGRSPTRRALPGWWSPTAGPERLPLPSLRAAGTDGDERWVFGERPYDDWRAALLGGERGRHRPPSGPRSSRPCAASGAWRRPRSRPSASCRARAPAPSSGGWPRSGASSRRGC